jgi:hypothetical protein
MHSLKSVLNLMALVASKDLWNKNKDTDIDNPCSIHLL